MSGINSGRRRTITSGAIEQFPSIALRVLKRAGLIRAGEYTYNTVGPQHAQRAPPSAFPSAISSMSIAVRCAVREFISRLTDDAELYAL